MSETTAIPGEEGILATQRTSTPGRRRTDFWAVVLAGGEGVRLRSLVRSVLGDERPKQYVPIFGGRTLLGQTLDRVGIGFAVDRTIVVTMEQHAAYTAEELTGCPHPLVFAQPADRGTAAAILAPTSEVARRDPAATVAVFPSDHYIPNGHAFIGYVAEVGTWIDAHPDRIVLLGAQATEPEVEYGWIEPGEKLGDVTTGPIRAVRQFWEKPSLARAERCLRAGHLWNTSVVIGKAEALLKAGRRGTPEIIDALGEAAAPSAEIGDHARALQHAYERMPKANFSRSVLEACPDSLAVARLPKLAWTDLGSPRRVIEVMDRLGIRPPWADRLTASA
jgi:mannose-1-phosphate guanylyltransferase